MAYKPIAIGIGFSIFFGIIESFIDTVGFYKGSLIEQIFTASTYEIRMRLIAVCITIIFCVFVQRNIAKSKKTEDTPGESEQWFRKIFESGAMGIVLADLDFKIIEANPKFCQMLGYTRQELKSLTFLDITHPDDVEYSRLGMRKFYKGEMPIFKTEKRYVNKSGNVLWGSVTVSLIHSAEGKPSHTLALIEDITEHKRAEKKIQSLNDLYGSVLEGIINGVWVTDKDDMIYYANKAMTKIAGIPRDQIVGARVLEDFPESTLEIFRHQYSKARETLTPVHYETVQVITGAGRQSYQSRWLVPRIKDGNFDGMICTVEDITERKKAEEALRESEEKFSKAFHSSSVLMFICTLEEDRRCIEVNEAALRTFGYKREEVIGKKVRDIAIYPDVAQRHAMLQAIKEKGSLKNFEAKLQTKSGEHRYGSLSVDIIQLQDKPCLLVAMNDITVRKQAEEAQAIRLQYEAGLAICSRTLLSDGPFAEIITKAIGHLLIASEASRVYIFENFNDANNGLCARQVYEVCAEGITPEIDNPHLQHLSYREFTVIKDNLPIKKYYGGIVSSLPARDREILEAQGVLSVLIIPIWVNGQWYGFIGFDDCVKEREWVNEDIRLLETAAAMISTYIERKRTQRELDFERKQLLSLFDSINEIIYVIDPDTHKILYVNKFLRELLGKNPVGNLCYKEFQGFERSCEFCTNERILKDKGKPYRWEYHNHVLKRDYAITDRIIKWPDDRDVRFALAIDITERKQAEEQKQRYAAELERSNQELQQFAYVASHDLQEPLRMVSSYVQLLARRYQGRLDADADEFISYAIDGASRMKTLINDLLAYSRVGTHGKVFEPTDCEVIFNRTIVNLQIIIKESKAVVTHDHLPTVMADNTQMSQLFQNLISNAIKFHGEEPARVHVSVELKEGKWLFSVCDDGIGIDPQYAERIFDIFQRLHTRGEYSGTGIGLAICKKIVERHGGCIWVESEPPKGSRFYFTIPQIERK